MRIGVCDNSSAWAEETARMMEEYGEQTGKHPMIQVFTSEEEVKASAESAFDMMLVNVDFDHDGYGIEIAAWVNQNWKACQIVFVGDDLRHVTDVYRTEHVFFVQKDMFNTYFPEIAKKVKHGVYDRYVFSIIGKSQGGIALRDEDIRYFERSKRQTNIVTSIGNYVTWEKIGDIYEKLNSDAFIRCHNSYIVRISAIEVMNKDDLILDDGMKISISRQYKKQTRDKYKNWIEENNYA